MALSRVGVFLYKMKTRSLRSRFSDACTRGRKLFRKCFLCSHCHISAETQTSVLRTGKRGPLTVFFTRTRLYQSRKQNKNRDLYASTLLRGRRDLSPERSPPPPAFFFFLAPRHRRSLMAWTWSRSFLLFSEVHGNPRRSNAGAPNCRLTTTLAGSVVVGVLRRRKKGSERVRGSRRVGRAIPRGPSLTQQGRTPTR